MACYEALITSPRGLRGVKASNVINDNLLYGPLHIHISLTRHF